MNDIHQIQNKKLLSWAEKEKNWRKPPVSLNYTWTVVDCLHSFHGNITYFLSEEDFQVFCMPLIRTLWINNYTIVIRPAVQ